MADDSFAASAARASSLAGNAPPGYGIRRAVTVDESAHLRRRPTMSPTASRGSFSAPRRRNSTFSDNLPDAGQRLDDDVLNSAGIAAKAEKSPYVYVPLVVALMPAVGGVLFENGSAFFTDLILLGVSAVFLHWSVTQPWRLYHTAREVRIVEDEYMTEPVFDSDDDLEAYSVASATTALENVPEEDEKERGKEPLEDKPSEVPLEDSRSPSRKEWDERKETAVKELYKYEMLALAWCFTFPLIGACLLHAIRGQLSRPSEGLISDFNLTIFLLAAEYRPVSHVLKLAQERTLHYQNIVARNPYQVRSVGGQQFQEIKERLNELESRAAAGDVASANAGGQSPNSRPVDHAALVRNVREGMQPELDALNRAVRRYEKKLAVLAGQIDNRLEYVDARLNDAIALAAVAVKHSNAQGNWSAWLVEKTANLIMIPINTTVALFTFPFRTAQKLLGQKSRPASDRSHRMGRNGRPSSGKVNPDRLTTRVSRKGA